uniref:Uncharacterized protein n=1 Tax=Anguilla anguilla TaxID=7936 RepID=A0A0E9UF92_ANGAN
MINSRNYTQSGQVGFSISHFPGNREQVLAARQSASAPRSLPEEGGEKTKLNYISGCFLTFLEFNLGSPAKEYFYVQNPKEKHGV